MRRYLFRKDKIEEKNPSIPTYHIIYNIPFAGKSKLGCYMWRRICVYTTSFFFQKIANNIAVSTPLAIYIICNIYISQRRYLYNITCYFVLLFPCPGLI